MNDRKIDDIEKLIEDFQRSGMRELHVRADDLEIYLSNDAASAGLDGGLDGQAASVTVAADPGPAMRETAPAPSPPAPTDIPDGAIVVTAPYLGSFYRAPKPGAPAYVEVGSRVTADTELCLVEVMKLFTAVRADVAGTVHAILATDGQMVEADQPLFVIIPA